jgi:hypothetical protein
MKSSHLIAKNPKSKSRVVNNSRNYQTVPYKSQTEVKSTASGYKTDLKEELKNGKCSCLGHNRFGITDSMRIHCYREAMPIQAIGLQVHERN